MQGNKFLRPQLIPALIWLSFSFPFSEAQTPLTTPVHDTQDDYIVLMPLTVVHNWTMDL